MATDIGRLGAAGSVDAAGARTTSAAGRECHSDEQPNNESGNPTTKAVMGFVLWPKYEFRRFFVHESRGQI